MPTSGRGSSPGMRGEYRAGTPHYWGGGLPDGLPDGHSPIIVGWEAARPGERPGESHNAAVIALEGGHCFAQRPISMGSEAGRAAVLGRGGGGVGTSLPTSPRSGKRGL